MPRYTHHAIKGKTSHGPTDTQTTNILRGRNLIRTVVSGPQYFKPRRNLLQKDIPFSLSRSCIQSSFLVVVKNFRVLKRWVVVEEIQQQSKKFSQILKEEELVSSKLLQLVIITLYISILHGLMTFL